MLRKIWIVLGAVALVTSLSDARLFAGDVHPPVDIAPAPNDFDKHRQANPVTDSMFAPAVSYAAGLFPHSVAVGDFDQDGSQDLVAANGGSNDLTVLLGHGDGTFAAGVSYAVGTSPHAVAVGDFDLDGSQDLVAANASSNDLTVLLGHGDGTFAAGMNYAVGSSPQAVAVGDFDRDRSQDLVVANARSHDVTVLLGLGDGTFPSGASYAARDWPFSVAVGDFNRDGRQDLVTANASILGPVGDVAVLLGHGDGTFADGVEYTVDANPFSIAVGDFDQDGSQDLVTAGEAVTVLPGHGDGTFADGVSYAVACSSVAAGDFDQDGWVDLVVTNCFPDHDVTVLLGLGDGTFADGESYAVGTSPRAVAVGDFERDGWPDLVTANFGSNDVSVLINQGGPRPISIDIKPDGYPNSINPGSRGVVPVAILGSDTFDVAAIDEATLGFGPGEANIVHRRAHFEDVNLDGIMDLMTHYRTQDTGITCGDQSATLTGETLDGQAIEGTDSINTVGCRGRGRPAIGMRDQEREADSTEERLIEIRKQ